jgi:GAF domain-containing protein
MNRPPSPAVPNSSPEFNASYLRLIENFVALTVGAKKTAALSKILPYALSISGAEVGAFLVVQSVDEQTEQKLSLVAQQGMPPDLLHQLASGQLQKEFDSQTVGKANMQVVQLNIIQTMLKQYQINQLVGLPLQIEGQMLGAIVLGSRQTKETIFTPTIRHQLATLSQLAAVFLDRVRLQTDNQRLTSQAPHLSPASPAPANQKMDFNNTSIEDLEKLLDAVMSAEEEVISHNTDLDMLNQLSSELAGTLNLHKILNKAIEQTRTALNAEAGWIYLFENNQLVLQAHQGLSEKYVKTLKYLRPGNGAEGMAFSRNESILRDTILFHSGQNRDMVKEEGIRIVAAAPLSMGTRPFGVICAANRGMYSNWSSRDEYMLHSIAQRVAQAVLNARMFTELQHKAIDLETQNSQLQKNAYQLSTDFGVLKQQISEILKFQEQVWLTLPAADDPRELLKQRATMRQSGDHVVTMIKRALQVISNQ